MLSNSTSPFALCATIDPLDVCHLSSAFLLCYPLITHDSVRNVQGLLQMGKDCAVLVLEVSQNHEDFLGGSNFRNAHPFSLQSSSKAF